MHGTKYFTLILILIISFSGCDSYVNNVNSPSDQIDTQRLNNENQVDFLAAGIEQRFATTYDPPRESLYFWAEMKSDDSGSNSSAASHFRHSGRANAVFCDGHTEDVIPDKLDDEERNIGWPSRDLCGWSNYY